ncbi:MAG TPA: CsgG/HfaB family protein [Gemmatimonadaceae bacterium]|jgi:TolB-like protein|nr:CsgG/HfaB family protein [Gemmatimonadaceae bacterium]
MLKYFARAAAMLAVMVAPVLAQDDTRPTVAVLPFVNSAIGSNNAELEPLTKGIADLLITDLAQNPRIRVVERENIMKLLAEQDLARDGRVEDATAARIGKLLGAKHMVTGSFLTDKTGTMVVTIKSIDSETGRIEWAHVERGKIDEFLSIIAKVGSTANMGLKLPEIPAAARQTSEAKAEKQKKIPFAAVMMYSRAISAQDAGNKAEAVSLFKQTVQKFPDFADAQSALKKIESGE